MDIVTEELRWTSNKDFAAYVAAECALSHMRVWQDQQQAADSPPNWFCNGYSANEFLELKKPWQSTESHLHSAKLEAERAERAKAKSERISSSFSKKLGFRHLQELAWQNSSPCFVSLKIL